MNEALASIQSEEFLVNTFSFGTTAAVLSFLRRSRQVEQIALALEQEALSDQTLRQLVQKLMREYRPGEAFAYDLSIAALAVAVEARPTQFAEELLHALARIDVPELRLSAHVARECLKARYRAVACDRAVGEDHELEWEPAGVVNVSSTAEEHEWDPTDHVTKDWDSAVAGEAA